MPRPGGESDKLGNRYEGQWTVDTLLAIADGEAGAITVEPLGEESAGIEFVLERHDGTRECHSVKRQKSSSDWTLAALSKPSQSTGRSILGDLFEIQRAENTRAVFVSSTGANQLRELVERAQAAADIDEFQKQLSSSAELLAAFEKRVLPLTNRQDEAYAQLRRLRPVLIDEQELVRRLEQQIEALIYRPDDDDIDATAVRLLLGDFVLQRLGQRIDAMTVWTYLKEHGYHRRDWARDPKIVEWFSHHNREYIEHVEAALIDGRRLERNESQQAYGSLTSGDDRVVVVSGTAGLGKSCVLAQIVSMLDGANVPQLCVRMDVLGEAVTPKQLGQQLGLPRSPVIVLAGVAHGRDCVLIVDQLDAVSIASGRNPQLWEAFDQLRREVSRYPKMRLLLACREFDLEHDHRLRRIVDPQASTKRIDLQPLSIDEVKVTLERVPLDPTRFSKQQLEILRIPYNLSLYLEGMPDDGERFQTVDDLYSRFWDRKRTAVKERLGRDVKWTDVIDTLTGHLSEHQTLSAPEDILDKYRGDAQAMASEHVLSLENGRYRFAHEGFFDYAFARRFAARSGDIIRLLLDGTSEQHLFRRAQVRQILAYERGRDFDRYLEHLEQLITEPRIRFHVKKAVFNWLSHLEDATDGEWELLDRLRERSELRSHVDSMLRGRLGWFDVLERTGALQYWLVSDDEEDVNRAIWLLSSLEVLDHRSEQVAMLIEPYQGKGEDWTRRLREIMSWGQAHRSRRMFDLFLALIDDGTLDDVGDLRPSDDWWMVLFHGARECPSLIAEAIAHWFDRTLHLARQRGEEEPYRNSGRSMNGAEIITSVASNESKLFARLLLPRVVALVRKTARESYDGHVRDHGWPLFVFGPPTNTWDALLAGLGNALEQLATSDPDALDQVTEGLDALPHDTIALLLLSAWSSNPAKYADRCAQYLAADRRRLDISYDILSSDRDEDAAISRAAVASIAPHCSADAYAKMEEAIIHLTPQLERRAPKRRGETELSLLRCIPPECLTPKGQSRLDELERKFPGRRFEMPRTGRETARGIGSPIAPERAAKMSDQNWTAAMRKHANAHGGFWKGGARELGQVLMLEARRDRDRFAQLVEQMDDDVSPFYLSAILDGITSRHGVPSEEKSQDDADLANFGTDKIANVIRRFHRLPGRPCGDSICAAIEKLAERTLPDDLLDIVSFYAMHDPDPRDEAWQTTTDSGQPIYGGDPHFHGINTVRGKAARTIAALLYADQRRLKELMSAITSLVEDRSQAVRSCTAEALLPILNVDRNQAVELFVRLCGGAEAIYATQPFEDFVHYAAQSHYHSLRSILQQALTSPKPEAVKTAARQICVASLAEELAEEDAARVRSGTAAMREAAAEVYANSLKVPGLESVCARHLRDFFADNSTEVRLAAAKCFDHFDGRQLNEHADLIGEFTASRAFADYPRGLIFALERSTEPLPDLIVRVAERAIAAFGVYGALPAYTAAYDASSVATLVVRLYHQNQDRVVQSRCLDLIDRMEELSYLGIASTLAKLDRV